MVTSALFDFSSETSVSLDLGLSANVASLTGCATCCGDDAIVCRCFQVTKQTVYDAVASGNARTISQLRCETGAGSGCMACLCKIKQLLAERAAVHAPEYAEAELAVA